MVETSPRRPATTTQLAEISSGTSYAAQKAAVSARSGVDRGHRQSSWQGGRSPRPPAARAARGARPPAASRGCQRSASGRIITMPAPYGRDEAQPAQRERTVTDCPSRKGSLSTCSRARREPCAIEGTLVAEVWPPPWHRGKAGHHAPSAVTDPNDPRLADYVRLRDATLRRSIEAAGGLFIAEGEKVIRRAVEAGYRPRSFLLAERWLSGLAGRPRPVAGCSGLRGERGTGRAGHRVPRPPRGAGLAAPRAAAHGRRPARAPPAGRAGGRRRPHQCRGDPAQRGRAGLGGRAAVAADRRPALPPGGQGQHGGGVLAALGPARRLGDALRVDWPTRASPPWRSRSRPTPSTSTRSRPDSAAGPAGGDHARHRGRGALDPVEPRAPRSGPGFR